jgi:RimJ/RimL family protein N-acetyltransferase
MKMETIGSLSTRRLLIAPLTVNDAGFIFELVNTEGWLTFIGNRNIRTQTEAKAYIQKIIGNPEITYWVVKLKEDQIPMGIVTFIKRDYLPHPDIGFAFLPGFTGKGYAFEATRAVLDQLLCSNRLTYILATTVPGNVKSIRLLNKLGLQFERQTASANGKVDVYAAPVARLGQQQMDEH